MGIKTVPHPPCSPDLAPCDFWLFPKLRGSRYETIEEMKEAVTKVIDTITQMDFYGAFQKLLERYNKCIATGGDYFKGDLSFMCVLSMKVLIRKKSGNLFNDPRMFLLGISPKKNNVRARLEFELSCYDVAVQHVSHYTTLFLDIYEWLMREREGEREREREGERERERDGERERERGGERARERAQQDCSFMCHCFLFLKRFIVWKLELFEKINCSDTINLHCCTRIVDLQAIQRFTSN